MINSEVEYRKLTRQMPEKFKGKEKKNTQDTKQCFEPISISIGNRKHTTSKDMVFVR